MFFRIGCEKIQSKHCTIALRYVYEHSLGIDVSIICDRCERCRKTKDDETDDAYEKRQGATCDHDGLSTVLYVRLRFSVRGFSTALQEEKI